MTDLESLVRLESKYGALVKEYSSALIKVRDLIALERAANHASESREEVPKLIIAPVHSGESQLQLSGDNFESLTKGDATARLLADGAHMSLNDLYAEMKKRGHPVKNARSLSSMLSTDKRFKSMGNGSWRMRTPQELQTQPQ